MNSLRPFEPSAKRPWDRVAASHLLRRAGFAPAEHEVQSTLDAGLAATVERLVDGAPEPARHAEVDNLGPGIAVRNDLDLLQGWWLLRMVHTARPLHARMAIFWHNHFATSYDKLRSGTLMLQQLRTFEQHGLGRFEHLLVAVSRDPGMIVWLDGDQNLKGRPNENYARELFELFALGVGNYSEADIREAARAFTGWHQRDGRFRFAAHEHDSGQKTVFGHTGPFDGTDVVRLTIRHDACGPFLARKLLREFVCPDPPAQLVDALAARLRDTGFDLAATMKTMLASEAMFEPRWYRARIKSPVEYVVGLVRSLEARAPGRRLSQWVAQMGQRVFAPPSVKGWDGHRAWINSATMLVRLNAAMTALRSSGNESIIDAGALLQRYDVSDTEAAIRFCGKLALDGRVPLGVREQLSEADGDTETSFRHALRLVLTCPEYHLA